MPPKKKGGAAAKAGKKKGGKKADSMIDGVSTTEMTREQLEVFAHRLREELEREREERNFFQLERDKLRTFWEITRHQLDESEAAVRNKDREIEEAEERHELEIKVYKRKVKFLLYEHQQNLAELQAEGMVSLKLAETDFNEQELQLLADKKQCKANLRELELIHEEEKRTLRMQHAEELSKIRSEFQAEMTESSSQHEKKLTTLRNDLILKHRTELVEVEERKNKQITDLMKNHDKALADLKNYYNDITLNNLALINSLKEQMEEVKKSEERMEKELRDMEIKNKELQVPLEEARITVSELTRKMENYEKDKTSLANTKTQLNICQKQLHDIKLENDVLNLRFTQLEKERDELRDRFVAAILELQQKSGLKSVLLEKKLTALSLMLEKREAQLSEVAAAAQIDPTGAAAMKKRLEELLGQKNTAIQDLRYELARVCKAHDDLLRTYEGKLQQYGIPKEELGFTPLKACVGIGKVGRGPAGLVTQNR